MIHSALAMVCVVTVWGASPSNVLFDASAAERQLQTFSVEGLEHPASGTVYPAGVLAQGGMPLGGLGTGYVCLDPDGRLGKCSIFNRLPAPLALDQPLLLLRSHGCLELSAGAGRTGHPGGGGPGRLGRANPQGGRPGQGTVSQ